MFRVFEGQTADMVWTQVAEALRKGEARKELSRAGDMREILHSAMSISEPSQRWVTSRMPPINLAFAIAEVVWILTGRNDSAFLNYFNSQLPKYAGDGKTYHGAYGYRLRKSLGIDQLEQACLALRAKPSSRQVVLQIWDGRLDLPRSDGAEAAADIPCNVVAILKVRAGKLEWMQIMRSNDIYRGLPYNFAQFTTLQEVMAGWLELEVGDYNQISDSLHVYESDFERIQASHAGPLIRNTDSLAFPKESSDKYFAQLEQDIESIIDERSSVHGLATILRDTELPEAFRNMLCVLCAEGARRRRQPYVAFDLISDCTNPVYKHLYERWLTQFNPKPDISPS